MKRILFLMLLGAVLVFIYGYEDSGNSHYPHALGAQEIQDIKDILKQFDSDDIAQGRLIYDKRCNACHGKGVSDEAHVGDSIYLERLAAKGMDALVSNAIHGFNAHPPKGLCMECTDYDIKVAILYMINESILSLNQ